MNQSAHHGLVAIAAAVLIGLAMPPMLSADLLSATAAKSQLAKPKVKASKNASKKKAGDLDPAPAQPNSKKKVKASKNSSKKKTGNPDPAPAQPDAAKKKEDESVEKKDAPATEPEQKVAETPAVKKEEVADDTTEKYNFAKISGGAAIVSGDKSMFRQRAQTTTDFSGGVEELHLQDEVAEKTNLTFDGRSIFDQHDYNLAIDVRRDDVGYINTGYREYRVWYDNSGGFFPKNAQWFDLYGDQVFAIDRGDIWFESGLTLPDMPEFIFRYDRLFRNGYKDSTSWGDSNLTGGFGTRRIVPAFWQIDEKRDIYSLEMNHHVEDTKFGIGMRYEVYDQDNGLYIRRRPYETATNRFVTQREVVQSDMFSVHGWQETDFGETDFGNNTRFSTAYGYTTLDTNLGGSRIYGAGFDTAYFPNFPNRQANDEGFINMGGGAKLQEHTATLNWTTMPCEDSTIVVALRIDNEDLDVVSTYQESNIVAGSGILDRVFARAHENRLNVAQRAEFKYIGIEDWVLYARADLEEGTGEWNSDDIDADTGVDQIFWDTDIERFAQKYTVGSYWYPCNAVSTATQYYYRMRETDYAFPRDSTFNSSTAGNRYPAYITLQKHMTHDLNMRVTAKPCSTVTAVSRYDFQLNKRFNGVGSLETVESGDIRTHILSETLTWNPLARLYMQGTLTWVFSDTDTATDERTGAAKDQVFDFQNSYWQAGFLTGYALTDDADLQAQYFFYRAYNYLDNSGQGLPYGAANEEHNVSLGLLYRISENVRWNIKYGFMRNLDQTSGSHNNFDAHLAYSSVDVAF